MSFQSALNKELRFHLDAEILARAVMAAVNDIGEKKEDFMRECDLHKCITEAFESYINSDPMHDVLKEYPLGDVAESVRSPSYVKYPIVERVRDLVLSRFNEKESSKNGYVSRLRSYLSSTQTDQKYTPSFKN